MNESEALLKMVAPRDRRPGAWRGGVMQVMVTRACDKACFGCTQGSNLGGKPVFMSPDQFEEALLSLKGYFGVIAPFGGNPAMHPQFPELCRLMRKHVPYAQRGLWCNHPLGHGALMRETFNSAVSNINVHLDQEAQAEFERDWPENTRLLGTDTDSRHSPPFVAMRDVIADESERWDLISNCDVNQRWSALIGVFRGELRGYFCELAYAQSALHQHEPDYPDTGLPITPGWWDQGMDAFSSQARKHCHDCGIPLRGHGELAIGGQSEQVSETHASAFHPKRRDRAVELVQLRTQLGSPLDVATNYIENATHVAEAPAAAPPVDLDCNPHTEPGVAGLIRTTRRELARIIELLPPNARLLEIGTDSGGTASRIADARPDVQITCLDIFAGWPHRSIAHSPSNWRTNQRPNMHLWVGDVASYAAQCGVLFDVVLIDGDHTEAGVARDLVTAPELLTPTGLLLAHDYADPGWPGVRAAVDRFCEQASQSHDHILGGWRVEECCWSLAVLRRCPGHSTTDVTLT